MAGSKQARPLDQVNQPINVRDGTSARQASPRPGPVGSAEDWRFTSRDFDVMQRAGAHLSFGPDSSWLPSALQQNVRASLETLLAPRNQAPPPMHPDEGVSVVDLYHAHVVVPVSPPLDQTTEQRLESLREPYAASADRVRTAYPEERINRYSLPMYRNEVSALAHQASPLLNALVQIPGLAVIYHSWEVNAPNSMVAGDPQRNHITPLSTNVCRPYRPPGYPRANFGDEYRSFFNLAFLVDRTGVIHVRPDIGLTALSTVTGRREGGLVSSQVQLQGTRPQEPPAEHARPPETIIDRLGAVTPPDQSRQEPIPSPPLTIRQPSR